jgi:hypothetical protein
MGNGLDGVAAVGFDLELLRHDRLTTDHATLPGALAGPSLAAD